MNTVLIVDDEEEICTLLEEALAKPGRKVRSTTDSEEALALAEHTPFDVVLSDINLNARRNGIDVLKAFRARSPHTQVILMTGYGTVESAVEGVRAGAFDYISKPFDVQDVIATVDRALRTASEDAPPDAPLRAAMPVGLVGRTASMLAVYKQIALAADASTPILIVGETGTGKELVARAIHSFGKASGRPFEALNCAVVPETLLASELFGHVKGSFTGAVSDKKGLFEVAEQRHHLSRRDRRNDPASAGEPASSPSGRRDPSRGRHPDDQGQRAGSGRDKPRPRSRGRREAFSSRPLLSPERLRYSRASPPRETRRHSPLLVGAFLRNACARAGRQVELTPGAVDVLASHSWPGNVRELENTIERLVLTTRSARVREEDVAEHFRSLVRHAGPRAFVGSAVA